MTSSRDQHTCHLGSSSILHHRASHRYGWRWQGYLTPQSLIAHAFFIILWWMRDTKNVSDSVRRHEKFYLLNISRTELIMFLKTDLLRAAWREVILLSNTDSRRRSRGQSPRSSATTGLEADIQTHSSWWLVWLGG